MADLIDRIANGVLNLMIVLALPFVAYLFAAPLF